jgi:hypothetical protein
MKQIEITEIAKVNITPMVEFTRSDYILELGHAAGPKTGPKIFWAYFLVCASYNHLMAGISL